MLEALVGKAVAAGKRAKATAGAMSAKAIGAAMPSDCIHRRSSAWLS